MDEKALKLASQYKHRCNGKVSSGNDGVSGFLLLPRNGIFAAIILLSLVHNEGSEKIIAIPFAIVTIT